MWERANLVRAFFWSQRANDEKLLLTHFLPRLRRFFGVDFCFGALSVSEETLVQVGVPEAGLSQLPQEFSRRCLESVANSRAPVTWNEAGIGLGFRSTVVVPLRAPTGPSFGFLMLGHGRARSYSALELFLLQALAGELSWVVRDLAARKFHEQKLISASQPIKNSLQVISGNAALMRQKMKHDSSAESEKHLHILPEGSPGQSEGPRPVGETVADIATMITQSASSCRAAKERGIEVEVVYVPESPGHELLISDPVKAILSALVDNAVLATRNETVRLTVRRAVDDMELVLRGLGSNRVADTLKSMFEAASRLEGARDENGEAMVRVPEYIKHAGGDVYLKNRPGESAEFVVRLPIERASQAVSLELENELESKDFL